MGKKKEMEKKEVSNKLIIGLLAIAILVSLVGTLVSLNKLGELKMGVTGMGTSSGTGDANLTIEGRTELTNRNLTLNWTGGYVNNSYTNCTLSTEGDGEGCVNFANLTKGFLLENTGNYNLSVNYSCSRAAADFIGGSDPSPELKIKVTGNLAAGQTDDSVLDTTASCDGGAWNISSYTDVTTGGAWLCGSLVNYTFEPNNDRDAAVVDIKILIPANAPAGDKKVSFTFNAHSAG